MEEQKVRLEASAWHLDPLHALQVRLARLDAERVFLGLSEPLALAEVRAGDFVFGAPEAKALLPEGAVYVERDCDLAAGKYRLAAPHADHPCWHFVALGDDGAQALGHMLALGLTLAQAEFNSPGALGRTAREYYALAHARFPDVFDEHLKRGAKR